MNIVRLVQARRLFNSPHVHPQINRMNMRKWVAIVRWLEDKWVLNQYQPKGWKQ